MRGILVLILIPVFIGLIAFAGSVKDSPPQMPQPTRGQSDGALCFGAVVFLGFAAMFVFPTLWDDTRDLLTGWNTPMPIRRAPHFWDRHTEVEWECEQEGTIYGYRYLYVMRDKRTVEFSSGTGGIRRGHNPVSNRPASSWRGMWNVSDRIPTLNNSSGIYAAKTSDSPVLDQYREPDTILVKLKLSGARIIEAEYGYRAQKAEIVEILEHIPPEA